MLIQGPRDHHPLRVETRPWHTFLFDCMKCCCTCRKQIQTPWWIKWNCCTGGWLCVCHLRCTHNIHNVVDRQAGSQWPAIRCVWETVAERKCFDYIMWMKRWRSFTIRWLFRNWPSVVRWSRRRCCFIIGVCSASAISSVNTTIAGGQFNSIPRKQAINSATTECSCFEL